MHRDRLFIFCGENYILSFDIHYWWFWLKKHNFSNWFVSFFILFFSSFSHRTSECLLCYYIHSYERRCNNVMLKIFFVSFLHKGRPEFRNHVMRRHSSEMRCFCLMKFHRKMLQNWPYFWNTMYIVVFVFHLVQLYFFPNVRAFIRDNAVVVRIEKR